MVGKQAIGLNQRQAYLKEISKASPALSHIPETLAGLPRGARSAARGNPRYSRAFRLAHAGSGRSSRTPGRLLAAQTPVPYRRGAVDSQPLGTELVVSRRNLRKLHSVDLPEPSELASRFRDVLETPVTDARDRGLAAGDSWLQRTPHFNRGALYGGVSDSEDEGEEEEEVEEVTERKSTTDTRRQPRDSVETQMDGRSGRRGTEGSPIDLRDEEDEEDEGVVEDITATTEEEPRDPRRRMDRSRKTPSRTPTEREFIEQTRSPGGTVSGSGPPILSGKGYYCEPSLDELRRMSDEELRAVENFIVGHEDFGYIEWPGYTDLRGLNLNEIISFGLRELEVYPDPEMKPEDGEFGSVGHVSFCSRLILVFFFIISHHVFVCSMYGVISFPSLPLSLPLSLSPSLPPCLPPTRRPTEQASSNRSVSLLADGQRHWTTESNAWTGPGRLCGASGERMSGGRIQLRRL